MIKVTGVIINKSYLIEGLQLEGTLREFGEVSVSSNLIRKFISRASLINNKFRNNEIDCSSGKIVRINGFKFSTCDLYLLKDNKIEKVVDDSIELLARVVQDKETLGFDVSLLGDIKRLSTTSVISLSELFKPKGFKVASRVEIVKRLDKNTNRLVDVEIRKPYLVGKSGNALVDLPIVYLDNSNKDTKVKTTTIQKQDVNSLEPDTSLYGIIELVDLVKKHNGLIVTNKQSNYTKQGNTSSDKDNSLFVPLEMVQVATPYINYTDKSVNCNLKFRKLGMVYRGDIPIPTYLWREKSIVSNGKHNLSKFSVAISSDGANDILKEFGKSLAVRNSSDVSYLKHIENIFGRKNLVLIDVDATNLDVIAKDSNYTISNKDILKHTLRLNRLKIIAKILKEVVNINESLWDKQVANSLRNYSNEDLASLSELGINISDGSYREPVVFNSSSDSSYNTKISIEYKIVGMKTLPSVNELLKSKSAKIIEALNLEDYMSLLDETDKNKIIKAQEELNSVNYEIDAIKKIIYLHKLNILKLNRFASFGDGSLWVAEKAKGNQKVVSYKCTEDGLDKLCISFENIDFAK